MRHIPTPDAALGERPAGDVFASSDGYLKRNGVSLHMQVKMDFEELATFRPDQIAAIMGGIATITSANRAEASASDNGGSEPSAVIGKATKAGL